MTNMEKIQSMTGEELAEFLMDWAVRLYCIDKPMPMNVQNWLGEEEEI